MSSLEISKEDFVENVFNASNPLKYLKMSNAKLNFEIDNALAMKSIENGEYEIIKYLVEKNPVKFFRFKEENFRLEVLFAFESIVPGFIDTNIDNIWHNVVSRQKYFDIAEHLVRTRRNNIIKLFDIIYCFGPIILDFILSLDPTIFSSAKPGSIIIEHLPLNYYNIDMTPFSFGSVY